MRQWRNDEDDQYEPHDPSVVNDLFAAQEAIQALRVNEGSRMRAAIDRTHWQKVIDSERC